MVGYRIFEKQWKEVYLLWIGRENIDSNEKESLIKKLVNFEDNCGVIIFMDFMNIKLILKRQ
jgi:hypothetical protein